MEDRTTSLRNDPYRPYARAGDARTLGRDGTIGYPAVVYLTLANVNPYWSESKRGMLPHELVHAVDLRSEEHTSELQSRSDIVCRLLLEKKNSQRLRTTRASARTFFTFRHYITPSARNF